MAKERVHKIIARLGLASRRQAEEWILEGAVTINGKVAEVGAQADLSEDAIKVHGKLLRRDDEKSRVYFAYHKPRGFISTLGADPQGRPSISMHISHLKARVFPIGRLEFNQEGLMILTDDGDFADRLRRSTDVVRVFRVKCDHEPTPAEVARLEKGGRVEGRLIQPYSVKLTERFTKKSMIEIAIQGMGAIDIKTFLSHKGFKVDRVILAAIGQITLGELAPGEIRPLKKTQIDTILERPELGLKRVDSKDGLALHVEKKSDDEVEESPRAERTRMPDERTQRANQWKKRDFESTQSFVIGSERRPPAKRFESKRSSASGAPKVRLTFAGESGGREDRREGGFRRERGAVSRDSARSGFGGERRSRDDRGGRSAGGVSRRGFSKRSSRR